MTTSKSLYNHLMALSQKAKRKTQVRKTRPSQPKNVKRVVDLAKIVFHSAAPICHHITTRKHLIVAPAPTTSTQKVATNATANKKLKHSKSKTAKKPSDDVDEKPTSANDATIILPTASINLSNKTESSDTYYSELNAKLALELQQMNDKKAEIRRRQVDFWGLYKYGLEHISGLNDLRAAPDAIMPGNFPEPPKPAAAAAAAVNSDSATISSNKTEEQRPAKEEVTARI